MHAALRVLPLALGTMTVGLMLRAQTASVPPIFAERTKTTTTASSIPAPTSLVSERVRNSITAASNRLLADAKAFDVPIPPSSDSAATLLPLSDTVLMPRYVVKSTVLGREAVRPRDLPWLNFTAVERLGDHRMIAGKTTNVLRLLNGQGEVNLNILQMAGRGTDHGRDFTRVEIEFRFRW